MRKTALITRVGLTSIFMLLLINSVSATSLPEGYTETTNYSALTYDILETNGLVALPTDTPYVWANSSNEVDGTLKLDYTGFYDEWGTMHPFFNLTMKFANGNINHTVANVSDSTLDMALILGFGGMIEGVWTSFSGGFVLPINWTANDLAANAAVNGTLDITTENGIHTYHYVQNPLNGGQETILKYNEATGVLQQWDSQFLNYDMKGTLQGFEQNTIPGYSSIFIIGLTMVSVGAIIYKKKH